MVKLTLFVYALPYKETPSPTSWSPKLRPIGAQCSHILPFVIKKTLEVSKIGNPNAGILFTLLLTAYLKWEMSYDTL